RENTLHAFAEAQLANGEIAVDAAVRASDADAFIVLNTRALAFDHAHADAQRVAGAEFRNALPFVESCDGLGLELLDQTHDGLPNRRAARQRQTGPERPCDAPKGPACVTVYLLPRELSSTRLSSHDPPIAALQGSCALPILQVGYSAGIRAALPRRIPRPRWTARPLRREAGECKRREWPERRAHRPRGRRRQG